MLFNYNVEYTEAKNNYTYTGMWDDIVCVAYNEADAIELTKQYFIENDVDPDNYIFKAKKYTEV